MEQEKNNQPKKFAIPQYLIWGLLTSVISFLITLKLFQDKNNGFWFPIYELICFLSIALGLFFIVRIVYALIYKEPIKSVLVSLLYIPVFIGIVYFLIFK
jgi:ABC-type transport system involved in cytochrome c biogenesis permease component